MIIDRHGGPESLRAVRLPIPECGDEELLVRVYACGVCGHDLLARQGLIGTSPPVVLGHEIAGVVAEVGSGVTELRPGDRVALVQRIPCGTCADCRAGETNACRAGPGFYGDDIPGGYAEFVIATERNAVRLPPEIPDGTGAILSCAVGTALRAVRAAELSAATVAVVTGAGGGVGIHAVQLAALAGATVVAQTTSPAKEPALRVAGASAVVHDLALLRDALRTLGRPRGADAVIETTGAPTFDGSLRALAPRGRLVLVGNTAPAELALPPGLVIVKELRVIGSAHATKGDLEEVVRLVSDGAVRPVVVSSWSLEEVADAHRALERRAVTGRAVVMVPR